LQGGEGETIVAKFSEASHFFLPRQANTWETEKQLYERMGTYENVVAIWPHEVQFWYLVAGLISGIYFARLVGGGVVTHCELQLILRVEIFRGKMASCQSALARS